MVHRCSDQLRAPAVSTGATLPWAAPPHVDHRVPRRRPGSRSPATPVAPAVRGRRWPGRTRARAPHDRRDAPWRPSAPATPRRARRLHRIRAVEAQPSFDPLSQVPSAPSRRGIARREVRRDADPSPDAADPQQRRRVSSTLLPESAASCPLEAVQGVGQPLAVLVHRQVARARRRRTRSARRLGRWRLERRPAASARSTGRRRGSVVRTQTARRRRGPASPAPAAAAYQRPSQHLGTCAATASGERRGDGGGRARSTVQPAGSPSSTSPAPSGSQTGPHGHRHARAPRRRGPPSAEKAGSVVVPRAGEQHGPRVRSAEQRRATAGSARPAEARRHERPGVERRRRR